MDSEQVKKSCVNCKYDKCLRGEAPCRICIQCMYWEPTLASNAVATPINPHHYTRFPIQPLTFITANNLDYLQGNIIKYVCRYPYKGGVTDLKKAQRYLEELIKKEEANVERPA